MPRKARKGVHKPGRKGERRGIPRLFHEKPSFRKHGVRDLHQELPRLLCDGVLHLLQVIFYLVQPINQPLKFL